jgi:peptide-methionine (R)-S-oxide reductase
MKRSFIYLLLLMPVLACNAQEKRTTKSNPDMKTMDTNHKFEVQKSEEEWKKELTPEQYYVLREKGTERPFTSKFEEQWDGGTYVCAACGNELFSSDAKFDAGCGWPSFYDQLDSSKVVTQVDNSHGMRRVEILCGRCGSHLGHVFDDGPKPTGLRYCVNGLSLDFKKKMEAGKNVK